MKSKLNATKLLSALIILTMIFSLFAVMPMTVSAIAPLAPSDLTATVDENGITLTWTDNSNDEMAFSIERKDNISAFVQIATAPANQTSYTDETAESGRTYIYKVGAIKLWEGITYSNQVTVTMSGDLSAYISPTNVVFVKGTDSDITLTVDLAGYTPQAIKNGDYTLQPGTDFVLVDSSTAILKASYLNSLDAGFQTITFEFNGGVNPTLKVTVIGTSATGATVSPTSVIFEKNNSGNITLTVNLAGYTLQAIKNGDYTLQSGTDFVFVDSNTAILNASYLNSLDVGVHTLSFNFSGGVNPTLTVTVSEAAPESYTVTFKPDNGEPNFAMSVTAGDTAEWGIGPFKDGYDFAGWYKDAALTQEYDMNTPVTADLTLYAKWTESDTDPDIPVYPGMSNFTKKKTYTSGMFTDVDENQWYGYNDQKVIANAYEYGLMQGDSATTFKPTGNITIAEAITIAARVYSIYMTGEENFIQGDPWYKVYVDYAIDNDIIKSNDFSDYTKAATRAEMAYIFSHSVPASELAAVNTVNLLPDVNNGTPYKDDIFMLYKAGILTGNDDNGTFYPGNNITRAEAAAIISRVILPATRKTGKTFG